MVVEIQWGGRASRIGAVPNAESSLEGRTDRSVVIQQSKFNKFALDRTTVVVCVVYSHIHIIMELLTNNYDRLRL